MELGFKPRRSGYGPHVLNDYITVHPLEYQDGRTPPETRGMVPGSILGVFMNPIWELGVGRILMFTELVLPSVLHPMSEEGLGTSKMKRKL